MPIHLSTTFGCKPLWNFKIHPVLTDKSKSLSSNNESMPCVILTLCAQIVIKKAPLPRCCKNVHKNDDPAGRVVNVVLPQKTFVLSVQVSRLNP